MGGEFIEVWEEAWREVWSPLIEHDGVPSDVFCELYRELAFALKDPPADITIAINDPILLREATESAFVKTGIVIERSKFLEEFDASGAILHETVPQRLAAAEATLATFMGDAGRASRLLDAELSDIVAEPSKRSEARERMIERVVNDPVRSTELFRQSSSQLLSGERALIAFLESAHDTLSDLGGDALANRYFGLLSDFIAKFNLRYDLRRPCVICPTLTGVFASLMRDLRTIATRDAHLDLLMKDFEESIRDLKQGPTDRRIRTCIQKQVNVLESIAQTFPGVTENTLGAMCNEITSWPHAELKEAIRRLYKFTCDYPGIRHAGTANSALRAVDLRDMIAVSILLAGFTPYLSNSLDANVIYGGA